MPFANERFAAVAGAILTAASSVFTQPVLLSGPTERRIEAVAHEIAAIYAAQSTTEPVPPFATWG